jgi:hypothetical protein
LPPGRNAARIVVPACACCSLGWEPITFPSLLLRHRCASRPSRIRLYDRPQGLDSVQNERPPLQSDRALRRLDPPAGF